MLVFAERLKAARIRRGLTQEELAAAVSVSRPTIAGYEAASKLRQPDFEVVCNIAEALMVSVDYLLGLTDEPDPVGAGVDSDVRLAARRLTAIRKSRNLVRESLAYNLGVDIASLIRYEIGADAMPDELIDRLARVFDVDRRYFTGELPEEAVEQILGRIYFQSPASISPETRQCISDFIDFMVERDRRRQK